MFGKKSIIVKENLIANVSRIKKNSTKIRPYGDKTTDFHARKMPASLKNA